MISRLFNRLKAPFRLSQPPLPAGVHAASRVRLESVSFEGSADLGEGCVISGRVQIGRFTTIGRECMICGRRDADALKIGSYCQLAPRVAIYVSNHRMDLLTTYVGGLLFSGSLKKTTKVCPVSIGHDVWIGHGAIVTPGVSIGHGAIIGAGAVVTKDVRPYAVAGGNPAREIRRRFDDATVELLLAWAWWDLSPEDMERHRDLFLISLTEERERFVEELKVRFPDVATKGVHHEA